MTAAPYSDVSSKGPSFGGESCLGWLRRAHNTDGGWGYRPGAVSAVEPTCWSLMAMLGRAPVHTGSSEAWPEIEPYRAGATWLRRTQLSDGSWPAFAGQTKGCWVTALACDVLRADKQSRDAVARGVRWLCNTWPAEWGLWRRVQRYLRLDSQVVQQNPALRGWSWTPGTASWVEPTAHVLVLLKSLPRDQLPAAAATRIQLAEAMLYDRMCPSGGWNAGNPMIYNVAGVPRVVPTCWALLALADQQDRPPIKLTVTWLTGVYTEIQAPGSLALAYLALRAHDVTVAAPDMALRSRCAVNECLSNVAVVAWVAMALAAK